MSEERNFSPTVERRTEARRQGQSPRGHDLTAVVVMLSGVCFLILSGSWWLQRLREMLAAGLSGPARISWQPGDAEQLVYDALSCVGLAVLPIAAVAWSAAVITQLGQGGWNWFPARALPDLKRLHPAEGCGRLFRTQMVGDGLLVVIRLGLGIALGTTTLWLMRGQLALPSGDLSQGLGNVAGNVLVVLAIVGMAFGVVAVGEFGYRWWVFENSLRMTSEEFRQHEREQQGDLRVRAMQRGAHQELSRKLLASLPPHANQAATTSRE